MLERDIHNDTSQIRFSKHTHNKNSFQSQMWTHLSVQFSPVSWQSNVGVLWQSPASASNAFHSITISWELHKQMMPWLWSVQHTIFSKTLSSKDLFSSLVISPRGAQRFFWVVRTKLLTSLILSFGGHPGLLHVLVVPFSWYIWNIAYYVIKGTPSWLATSMLFMPTSIFQQCGHELLGPKSYSIHLCLNYKVSDFLLPYSSQIHNCLLHQVVVT